MKTQHTLGILFLLAPLIAVADPATRIQKMSDRVIFRNNTFYPKTEFSGKNFSRGQWQTALPDTQNPWLSSGGLITNSPASANYYMEMSSKITGSTGIYGGLPGVVMTKLIKNDQDKAQFLEDWKSGETTGSRFGMAQGQAVALDSMCSLLNADLDYAKELYIATINTMEVGGKKTSNPITSAILSAGSAAAPSRQPTLTAPPMDLTGTGITLDKFINAVGVTSLYNTDAYKSKVIFDEP